MNLFTKVGNVLKRFFVFWKTVENCRMNKKVQECDHHPQKLKRRLDMTDDLKQSTHVSDKSNNP